jgi:hypothetical protein
MISCRDIMLWFLNHIKKSEDKKMELVEKSERRFPYAYRPKDKSKLWKMSDTLATKAEISELERNDKNHYVWPYIIGDKLPA